jgi:hypothetical protein
MPREREDDEDAKIADSRRLLAPPENLGRTYTSSTKNEILIITTG